MSPLPRMKPIVPWWQLGVLLLLCGAAIYLLVPDDAQLIERLIRDGKAREAQRLLDHTGPATRARDPSRFKLLEIQVARLNLRADDPGALAAFWSQAARAWWDSGYAPALFQELLAVVPRLRDPAAATELVAADLQRAPAGQRQTLTDALVRAALAANQQTAAAELYARAYPAPGRTAPQAVELARLWQLAGRPEAALTALGDLDAPVVTVQRLSLLRALNRNREALQLLRAQLAPLSTGAVDSKLVEEIGRVALQAGAPGEAVDVYEAFVAAHPENLAGWRTLRDLLIAAGRGGEATNAAARAAALSREASDDLRALAQVYEWSGEPARAFDTWLPLARQGDDPAIDRLLALNPGLFRDAELATVLDAALAHDARPERLLRLARLQVELGRYDAARRTFERYLTQRRDPAAMADLIKVHRENFAYAEAEKWLRELAAIQPGDVAVRREIAETLVLQGRHADALAVYGELLDKTQQEDVIGPFTRIAESLGKFDEFARGLQRRVAALETPAARDYILLVYAYELAARPRERRAALEEGLRRFPENGDLRLQFAYLLANDRRYAEAQRALAPHPELHAVPAVAAFYLDLLRLNNDTAGERAFLQRTLAPAAANDDAVIERVARAREALGDWAAAERGWRELAARRPGDFGPVADLARVLLQTGRAREARTLLAPFLVAPTPAVLRTAAEVAAAAGDARAAERYQLAYLAATKDAPPTDWGALGDIRLSRGDRTGAKRAYAEALRRMQSELLEKGGSE